MYFSRYGRAAAVAVLAAAVLLAGCEEWFQDGYGDEDYEDDSGYITDEP